MSADKIAKAGNLYKVGESSESPWGTWIVLDAGENYVVKKLVVLPRKRLSLQYHNHRQETWTITSGQALVEIDNKQQSLKPSQTVIILKNQHHRLSNPDDKEPLVVIEVSLGSKLDESDIVRIEDDFKRI